MKKTVSMSEHFPELKPSKANLKFELDLSNYETKARFKKNATRVDKSAFADLANLKSDVDWVDIDKLKNEPNNLGNLKSQAHKLDIQKLETAPVDLSKLSNVVKIDVVKKTEYNELVKKVNNISNTETSILV